MNGDPRGKRYRIDVMVYADEKARIQKLAEDQGLGMSAYMRQIALIEWAKWDAKRKAGKL